MKRLGRADPKQFLIPSVAHYAGSRAIRTFTSAGGQNAGWGEGSLGPLGLGELCLTLSQRQWEATKERLAVRFFFKVFKAS